MARGSKDVLLRIKGNATDATRALDSVRSDLKRMSKEEAEVRIDIQTARVERQIQQVKRRLETLSKKPTTARVEVDTARAQEQLTLLEFRLDKLRLKKVNIDVDVSRGKFETAAGLVSRVERNVGGLSGAFGNLLRAVPLIGTTLGFAFRGLIGLASQAGQVIGEMVGSVGALGRLGGVFGSIIGGVVSVVGQLVAFGAVAGGIVIVVNALVGAIAAFGAALVALAASLAAALGGLGALGAAFLGVMGPAVLVLIGLFQRFQKILEARKAREQALTEAVQEQKTAEDQRRSALLTLEAAEEQLAQTVVDGRRAMTQAAEDQADAERSLARSRLNVQTARLNLRDAKAELRDFLRTAGAVGPTLNSLTKKFTDVDFDPSSAGRTLGDATGRGVSGDKSRELQRKILEVRDAQLDVKDSIDAVGDSERALNEARRRHTRFTEQGLRAYRPYRQALVQVERAQNGLTRATERTSAAQRDYRQKLAELTTTERGTLDRVNRLVDGFTRLAKVFTDPIFQALNEVFDSLSGSGEGLERGLRAIGRAFGDVIRSMGSFLRERDTRTAFSQMARGAASLARSLGAGAFTSFLRIMRNIATAALPALMSGAGRVADVMAGWARDSGLPAFRRTIRTLIDHFKEWANLARALGGAILAVFRGASRSGRGIVRALADWLDKQTKILNQNPEKVEAFFRRMVRRARAVVDWLQQAAEWLRTHLPSAAETAKGGFQTLARIASGIYNSFQALAKLMRGDLKGAAEDLSASGIFKGALGLAGKASRGPMLGPRAVKWLFDKFHDGGIIGGSGEVGIRALGGEAVLNQGVVAALGASTINALNAAGRGLTPRMAGPSFNSPRTVNMHNHFHTPGGRSADERSAAARLEREIRIAGG